MNGLIRGVVIAASLLGATGAMAQDAEKGAKVFKKCAACHAIGEDAKNKVGPVLNGIVGSAAAQNPDFSYSSAMADSGLTWDEATLDTFLTKPKDLVDGTKMSFAGLKKDSDRADVIAYLNTFNADGTLK